MLPSIPEPQENELGQQTPSGSERSGSSNWQNDSQSSGNESQSGASQSGEESDGEGAAEEEESSDSSDESSTISNSSLGQVSRKRRRTPDLKGSKGSSFGGAVSSLVDLVQCSLHALQPPGPRAVTSISVASPEAPVEDPELPRVPSLRTLLKFPDQDENHEAGAEVFEGRSQRSQWKDGHGRVHHNLNSVNFETLALGLGRNESKRQTELQKSWGEIAGKLAFVLTKVDQVVPMSKATLLNEALGGANPNDKRMSDESVQLLEMILKSKKFLGSAFHALLESDPVKVLKDSLEARLNSGPGGGLFAQQEELNAYEKEINVREHQMDNPEFVDMMLQRWFAQKGFCVNNVAERRHLAEEFWKLQCSRAKKRNKRLQGMSTKSRSSLSVEAFQATLSMQSEQEQDLSTERGIKMEIKRAMTKLKRKCRVLEGQWVEQPRMMLPRLERQCRSLRAKVEDKFLETETTRKKLCEADTRWQRTRDGYEPTLVDLELQAWDTRVELAKSVIRWVRRDRKEAQVEWKAQIAKYHADPYAWKL